MRDVCDLNGRRAEHDMWLRRNLAEKLKLQTSRSCSSTTRMIHDPPF